MAKGAAMAPTISRCRPRSFEEIDAMLAECQQQATLEGHVVMVYMTFSPPVNKPCPFCDSGKKWKRCSCRELDFVELTVWPNGKPRLPKRSKHSRLGAAMALAMAHVMLDRESF
jgi:hypothetical protein